MKKEKTTKATPQAQETVEINNFDLTIGELAEIAKSYPAGTKFSFNELDNNSNDYGDEQIKSDLAFMNDFRFIVEHYAIGDLAEDPDRIRNIRYATEQEILDADLLNPNIVQLSYENDMLEPSQSQFINEMRYHNAQIAENMAEMFRRGISAMLEYNTQCIANMTATNNKVMCDITKCKMGDK